MPIKFSFLNCFLKDLQLSSLLIGSGIEFPTYHYKRRSLTAGWAVLYFSQPVQAPVPFEQLCYMPFYTLLIELTTYTYQTWQMLSVALLVVLAGCLPSFEAVTYTAEETLLMKCYAQYKDDVYQNKVGICTFVQVSLKPPSRLFYDSPHG